MIANTSSETRGDILIIDDDLGSLRLLSNLLVERNFQVRGSRDGATALIMIAAEPPDLVLLDIQMPGIDGYQVCEQIKNNPASRDIPVLFISAMDEPADILKGFKIGGVDFITKPYHTEEILARIETHITISRLNTKLLAQLKELSALHQISQTIASSPELIPALELICRTITDLFGGRLTMVILQGKKHDGQKGLVGYEKINGAISLSPDEPKRIDFSALRSQQDEGEPAITTNLHSIPFPDPLREFIQDHNLQSGLTIPLISREVDLGILLLAKDEKGSTFTSNQIRLAEMIAADIAVAIQNDQLIEQAQLAAVDAERARLARELHDSVTQSIYSLTLLSSGWERMARQGTLADPADSFQHLGAVGQQALREMRLLLHQMRPSVLAEVGLVHAIQRRLDTVEQRANINAQLLVHGNPNSLPQRIEDEVFSIAQEALNNSLRHARAESVKVSIAEEQGELTLMVEDDGIGFDPSSNYSGMGLSNMQIRADAIAANLSIESEAEQGTRVKVTVRGA